MDKNWVFLDRGSDEYIFGLRAFISHAQNISPVPNKIYCPCKECKNRWRQTVKAVEDHISCVGMWNDYVNIPWTSHGEELPVTNEGKQNEYVDAASTKAVQDLEKAEEERKRINVDITPQVREDIYAQVLGPEKRNRVRGLGAGVRWRDVPYLHTEKRSISATMEAMKATIEEQRLETARLRSEAEKERQEAAQREERNRIELAEMNKRFAAQMEEFKKQQEAAMEENARKVNELARLQGIRWMKEAGFSGIETAPQLDSDPMTQLAAVQPQCNRPAIPTPPIEDVYRPEMPRTVQESQLN